MKWGQGVLGTLAVVLAVALFPAAASALDSDDSISITAPVTVAGAGAPLYAGYPFTFNGGGSADSNIDGYDEQVLFTPSSSPILQPACPTDYDTAVQAIELAYGGPNDLYAYEAEGVSELSNDGGPYTYGAEVNGETLPTVTSPGHFVACAYLLDDLDDSDTLAVSPTPVAFTVQDPPGSGTPPSAFGGPRGKTSRPSNLTLRVAPRRRPVLAPGRNLFEISGRFDPSSGPAGLEITLKQTSRYNGCAANDELDDQITRADGGAVIAISDGVSPSQAGVFKSPVALNFKRRVKGTLVLCAYLVSGIDDLAVGYDRFTTAKPKPKPKHKARPKPKGKARG